MGKKIVYCSDGTWDTPAKDTNVVKLFNALTKSSTQAPYYDSGVGTDGSEIQKLLEGGTGAGIFQKIKNGYTDVANSYEKDDEIFLFGFSRGAFTARSLAGMIANCGLPTANFTDAMVNEAFTAYRTRDKSARQALLAKLIDKYGLYDAKITMVGVWDTVGSLGIPALFGGVDPLLDGFLDTGLHSDVRNGYHAMAIDEKRLQFPVTLWDESKVVPGQTIEQVWFSGMHGDIGGGDTTNPDGSALCDLAFAWMLKKALALGLEVAPGVVAKYALPMDPKVALYPNHPSATLPFPRLRHIAEGSILADSVSARCAADGSYRPGNLTLVNGVPASTYKKEPVIGAPAISATN
jgi:uncharacterized protein (DUF2235 family)